MGFIYFYSLILIHPYLACWWMSFPAAGRKSWEAIVPGYNYYVAFHVTNKKGWWSFLLVIPGVHLVMLAVLNLTYIRKFDNPVILKTDIAKFYDSIPRDRSIELCKQIGLRPDLLQLLLNWSKNMHIKHSSFNLSAGNETFIGLPQGLSISSLLAELYVKQIDDNFNNVEGYFRYVDDIVIICKNIEDARNKLEKLKLFLEELQLQLSANKTEIVEFTRGMEWLGLYHYPNGKYMHPEKLVRAVKPIHSLQKECLRQIALSSY